MAKAWAWQISSGGGGGATEPTGPAGGVLKGEYPNPGMAAEAVKPENLAAEAVETAEIKNLNVTAGKLASEAVETAKIKAKAVTTAKIEDANITTALLGPESVETAKIKLLAVTAATLAANAVETAKVKNEAITKEKLSTGVQEELEPKVMERSFAIAGEIKNESYPGFFVKLGTHEEKKLIGIEYEILEGTSVELELQKANSGKSEAAAGIAGYKVTEATAKKEPKRIASTKALANEDRITLKCSGGAGTPKGLICTLFIESVK